MMKNTMKTLCAVLCLMLLAMPLAVAMAALDWGTPIGEDKTFIGDRKYVNIEEIYNQPPLPSTVVYDAATKTAEVYGIQNPKSGLVYLGTLEGDEAKDAHNEYKKNKTRFLDGVNLMIASHANTFVNNEKAIEQTEEKYAQQEASKEQEPTLLTLSATGGVYTLNGTVESRITISGAIPRNVEISDDLSKVTLDGVAVLGDVKVSPETKVELVGNKNIVASINGDDTTRGLAFDKEKGKVSIGYDLDPLDVTISTNLGKRYNLGIPANGTFSVNGIKITGEIPDTSKGFFQPSGVFLRNIKSISEYVDYLEKDLEGSDQKLYAVEYNAETGAFTLFFQVPSTSDPTQFVIKSITCDVDDCPYTGFKLYGIKELKNAEFDIELADGSRKKVRVTQVSLDEPADTQGGQSDNSSSGDSGGGEQPPPNNSNNNPDLDLAVP